MPAPVIVSNRSGRSCERCGLEQHLIIGDFSGSYCNDCYNHLENDKREWRRRMLVKKAALARRLRRNNVRVEWGGRGLPEYAYTVKHLRRSTRAKK